MTILRQALLILLAAYFGLTGCAAKRVIQDDNVFLSSANPPTKIKVNHEINYIGKVADQREVTYLYGKGGSIVDAESYLFAMNKNKNLIKGIIIRISEIKVGVHLPVLFDGIQRKLKAGIVKLNGQNYQFVVAPAENIFSSRENKLISDTGYIIQPCYMAKALGRIFATEDNGWIVITYFADIKGMGGNYTCKEWSEKTC